MRKLKLTAAALALLSLSALAAPCKTDNASKREKEIDRMLSQMTLEQKIGQMIQLEINQVTYYNPETSYQALMQAGPEKLQKIITDAGLQNQYDAEKMFRELDPNNLETTYPFFYLSLSLSAFDPFELDDDKMKTVFGEHHVGTIINMLGSAEASDLDLWRKSIARMEAASMRYDKCTSKVQF